MHYCEDLCGVVLGSSVCYIDLNLGRGNPIQVFNGKILFLFQRDECQSEAADHLEKLIYLRFLAGINHVIWIQLFFFFIMGPLHFVLQCQMRMLTPIFWDPQIFFVISQLHKLPIISLNVYIQRHMLDTHEQSYRNTAFVYWVLHITFRIQMKYCMERMSLEKRPKEPASQSPAFTCLICLLSASCMPGNLQHIQLQVGEHPDPQLLTLCTLEMACMQLQIGQLHNLQLCMLFCGTSSCAFWGSLTPSSLHCGHISRGALMHQSDYRIGIDYKEN